MQKGHEEEQAHQWARPRQQTSQRGVLQEHQHMQAQQRKEEEHMPSEPRAVAESQVCFSEVLKEAHRPAELESERHTASRRWSFRAPVQERWQRQAHAEPPQRTVPLTPLQQQHENHSYEDINTLGVDCSVPFISSAAPILSQRGQQRPEFVLSPATVTRSSSLPDVHAVRQSEKIPHAAKVETERAVREDEDDHSYSHSTRGSSGNSNFHQSGGARREEQTEGESKEGAGTNSPTDATGRLHVAENVVDLHAADSPFSDTIGSSRSLAAKQKGPTEGIAAVPSSQRECRLRDIIVASDHSDCAALPSIASPFYHNVLSAEATSDSGGSVTSPATSPTAARSPHAVTPYTPASPVSICTARHSPASPYAVHRIDTPHGTRLSPVLPSEPSTRAMPSTQEQTGHYSSSSSPDVSCPYDRFEARSMARTSSQQTRSHQLGHEGTKKRSSYTGGGHSNESSAASLYSPNSRSTQSVSSSAPHHSSAAMLSPFATSFSTSSRPSPTALASSSLSPSAAARTSPDGWQPEEPFCLQELESPVVLTPVAGAEEAFAPRMHRRSTWGRPLTRREDPAEVSVKNCIYRQKEVKHLDLHPVPLPNGESLNQSPFLCTPESQQQEVVLGRGFPPDRTSPMALPYNAEEALPSPFSNAGSSSHSDANVCEDDTGISHVTHKRGTITSALEAMHIPTHFLPPYYSSATPSKRACDAALDHADFSPPIPFFPSSYHSSAQETSGVADQQCLPYPQFSARTCAVHKQPHTFVYPFEVAEAAIPSAARISPSTSLFRTKPKSTVSEPQQPVRTYYISNNGMGQTVQYNSRAIPSQAKRPRTKWFRWLWRWGRDHSIRSSQQQQQGTYSVETQDAAALRRSASTASSSTLPLSLSPMADSAFCSHTLEQHSSADGSRKRADVGKFSSASSKEDSVDTTIPSESSFAGGRTYSGSQGGSRRQPSRRERITKCRLAGGGSRGTFVLAAVSAALEIGCVWRFPSYCYKFGGATFLVAYVILLVVLGLPILALEMALGQVFRGGQMKVLNLISPRLRGLAAAMLLLSFFICAYYSIFVSWTLQFLVSSARAALPWAVTPQDAAICSAAGRNPAACIRATLPTPFLFTESVRQEQQRLFAERAHDYHLQQTRQRRLSAQQKKEETRIQHDAHNEQAFCAWKKKFSSTAEGVCVADDKLKARVFLYTDVLGIWEKNTERTSAVHKVIPSPSTSPITASPATTSPSTSALPRSRSALPQIPAPPSRLVPFQIESEKNSFSVVSPRDEAESFAASAPAGKTEPAEFPAGEGLRVNATIPADVKENDAAAGERQNISTESAVQTATETTLTYRRLSSSSPAASLKTRASRRVTSVTSTTSAWSIAPLLAVGLVTVWIQIYLFSLRGYKPSTICSYITALIPIVAMLVIAGLALSLDGASLGIQHLFSLTPQMLSPPSLTKSSALPAPARHSHMHITSDEISAAAVLPGGASSYAADVKKLPGNATGEGHARILATSVEQYADKYMVSSAAAPCPTVTAHSPSPSVAAASESQRDSRKCNNIQKMDVTSSLLSCWPRWLAAGSHPVWGEAAAQVFFSLGVFQGVVPAYASHKHLTENVLVDAAAAAITNLCMSLLAAVATFAVAGHVAKGLGAVQAGARAAADLSVLQDIQGSQLVFVLYPLAFASLPIGVAQLACILCFLALLLLGLVSVVGLVQPLTGLLRRCSGVENCPRWKIVAAVCAMGFLMGMPFCTRGGLLLLEAADYHWTVVGLIFMGCCESIAFGWLYGVGRQAQCVGYLPVLLHGITYWIAVLLAAGMIFLSPPPYNTLKIALGVGLSVAIAGAAAALWYCPWKKRKKKHTEGQPQGERERDVQKKLATAQQEEVKRQQAQQQMQPHVRQAPVKRKGKAQTEMTEKSRVKFNNGCAGSTECGDYIQSVDNSDSMTQGEQTLHSQTDNGSTHSRRATDSGDSNNVSTEGGARDNLRSGTGSSSSCTSSDDGAIHATRTGASASRSREGGTIRLTGSGLCRKGDASSNEPVQSSSTCRKVNESTEGNSTTDHGGNTCSQYGGDNTCAKSHTSSPSAHLENEGSRPSSAAVGQNGIRNTVTGASSNNSRCEALSGPSGGVNSIVTGDVGQDLVLLHEGRKKNQAVYSGTAAAENSNDASGASDPINNSNNGNNGTYDVHGQGYPVSVPDTKELAVANTSSKQHHKRYESPRGRSSRRKRGRRDFVFIKRKGETLTFTACVFWLFVGNVEHLRKNLNAITCSGYRILRLWPPWSLLIRYIIPTILTLLMVQEIPQLFHIVNRYNRSPSTSGITYSAAVTGPTPHFKHQIQLQQSLATEQEHPLFQHLPSVQHQFQQISQKQQVEKETLQRTTFLPGINVSWHSLVAIDAFTLGALFFLVGLIVIGLLLPHIWKAFVPKERRRPISGAASSMASCRV